MRNFFILTLLVAVIAFAGMSANAASISTSGPGNPADVGESPINAMLIPATQTFSLNGTATLIGTVPAGSHCVWICAYGPVNIGNASVTLNVAGLGGIPIASGSYLKLNLRKDDATPAIYMINGTTGATSTVRLIYGR